MAALTACGKGLHPTAPVKTADLLAIYRVRLRRWRDDGAPECLGLPEFVSALESCGQDKLVVAEYQAPGYVFVLLLPTALDRLVACVMIEASSDGGRP